jgi:hypothetical protein
MNKSPTGSKLLSVYGIIFAGVLPLIAAIFLIAKAGFYLALITIPLSSAIIYFGIQVFSGRKRSIKIFAILVMLHYSAYPIPISVIVITTPKAHTPPR